MRLRALPSPFRATDCRGSLGFNLNTPFLCSTGEAVGRRPFPTCCSALCFVLQCVSSGEMSRAVVAAVLCVGALVTLLLFATLLPQAAPGVSRLQTMICQQSSSAPLEPFSEEQVRLSLCATCLPLL